MKKSKLLLLGAILASFSFNAAAEGDPEFNPANITSTYNRPYNNDKQEYERDRHLDSFKLTNSTGNVDGSLNEPTFEVNQPTDHGSDLYVNLSEGDSPIFQTKPGNTVRFASVTGATGWQHGYLYINYNKDSGFNSKLNTTGYTINNSSMTSSSLITIDDVDGELVSFSCFNLSTTGSSFVDSRGNNISTNTGQTKHYGSGVTPSTMPEFMIPEGLEPGIYDALLKTDWSYLDQHGNPGNAAGKDIIGDNGGCIVKFRIEVVAHVKYTVTVNSSDDSKGSVSLKVDGQAIPETSTSVFTNQTVVAVATPAADHYFYHWTDDETGQIVSRENEYTVTLTGDVSLTANFLNQEEYDKLPDELFDPNKITSTYGDRPSWDLKQLKSFQLTNHTGNEDNALSEPTFTVNQSTSKGSSLYYDRTSSDPFQTKAGNIVKFATIDWPYHWMHGFLFIDYNKDGGFNSKLNTGFELTTNKDKIESAITIDPVKGDLVSFWGYNVKDGEDDYFVDSHGTFITKDESQPVHYGTGVSASLMPEFKIPDNLPAGTYDALFKIDWSHIGQHGNPGAYNDKGELENIIGNNGGVIVKFQIEVVNPLYITGHAETNTSYEDAAIITINYTTEGIAEGDKLVAVATQTGKVGPESGAAASNFTTLANDANTVLAGVIMAREASPDGTTLKFNLDENQNQAQLLFEQPTWDAEGNKTNNFKANTQYTYEIVLQTEDAEGNVTGVGHPYSLQFTTANNGDTLGVEDVVEDDSNSPVQYFNLQGIQVNQPAPGQIYIVRQGKSVQKVLVK